MNMRQIVVVVAWLAVFTGGSQVVHAQSRAGKSDRNSAMSDREQFNRWRERRATLEVAKSRKEEAARQAYKAWKGMPPPPPGTPYRERIRQKALAEAEYRRRAEEQKEVERKLNEARKQAQTYADRLGVEHNPGRLSQPQNKDGRNRRLYQGGQAREQLEHIDKTRQWENRGSSKGPAHAVKIARLESQFAHYEAQLVDNQRRIRAHNQNPNRTDATTERLNRELDTILKKLYRVYSELEDLKQHED